MPAGFFAPDDFESHGVLNVVQRFNPISAKPKAHEIRARLKKNFAEKERRSPFLAGAEADKFSLLACVRVDHAIAVCVVEDHRQIAVGKTAQALHLYFDSKIAAWVGSLQLPFLLAQRPDGD